MSVAPEGIGGSPDGSNADQWLEVAEMGRGIPYSFYEYDGPLLESETDANRVVHSRVADPAVALRVADLEREKRDPALRERSKAAKIAEKHEGSLGTPGAYRNYNYDVDGTWIEFDDRTHQRIIDDRLTRAERLEEEAKEASDAEVAAQLKSGFWDRR